MPAILFVVPVILTLETLPIDPEGATRLSYVFDERRK